MVKKKNDKLDPVGETAVLEAKIADLEANLLIEKEKAARAIADYQNLQRRSREERARFVKLANLDFCMAILQPLEHLSLAALEVEDQGLNMVISQLWKQLNAFGLERIEVLGKNFNLETMEVVDQEGKGEKVTQIVRQGYRLNGEVIQHAQVVLG